MIQHIKKHTSDNTPLQTKLTSQYLFTKNDHAYPELVSKLASEVERVMLLTEKKSKMLVVSYGKIEMSVKTKLNARFSPNQ